MDQKRAAPAEAGLSIPELLQKLANESSTLVRQEIALARAELSEKAAKVQRAIPAFAVAAILAVGAFLALTAAFVLALALVLPPWAAALVVTVVYAVGALAGVQSGRAAMKRVGAIVPQRTVETLQEDVEAVREGVRRGR